MAKRIFLIIILFIIIIYGYKYTSNLIAYRKNKWVFAGYQYRWSQKYVQKRGILSELECIDFGEKWLEKQESEEAMFTCSIGCRPYEDSGMDICKKICEYNKEGFTHCRE